MNEMLLGAANKVAARDFTVTKNANVLSARDESGAAATNANIAARQGGTFAITGVQGSGVQPRLEMRELARADPDQWNMLILAFDRMQKVPQGDLLSYYQIAGIHGRPLRPWDGVNGVPGANNGYCTHISNLFPTWHRPYLSLFEVRALVESGGLCDLTVYDFLTNHTASSELQRSRRCQPVHC